jgi:LysM repeat protein
LSLMLKRGIEILVGAALMVALLAVLPALAEAQEGAASAQEEARSAKRSADATSVVVRLGDSLWSISEERLGQDATPQQIAGEVERIYALNQDQIGSDPDLIFPGQKFLLPTPGRTAMAEPASGAGREREVTERKQEGPAGRGAKRETSQISETPAVGSPTYKAEKAPEAVAGAVNLPDTPAANPVPAARAVSSNDGPVRSPVTSFVNTVRSALASTVTVAVGTLDEFFTELRDRAEERQLLGWGIIALTLVLGVLLAWKLSIRRYTRDQIEEWGIPSGYQQRHRVYSSTPVQTESEPYPGTTGGGKAQPKTNALPTNNDATMQIGLGRMAQAKRKIIRNRRVSRQDRLPRNGLATGVHAPEVRRFLLRAAPRSRPRTRGLARTRGANRQGGR